MRIKARFILDKNTQDYHKEYVTQEIFNKIGSEIKTLIGIKIEEEGDFNVFSTDFIILPSDKVMSLSTDDLCILKALIAKMEINPDAEPLIVTL
jgi:hypothetical protein